MSNMSEENMEQTTADDGLRTAGAVDGPKAADHPAVSNLRTCQRQLDMDGCEVGVSRQALEETLALIDNAREALAALARPDGFARLWCDEELEARIAFASRALASTSAPVDEAGRSVRSAASQRQ